MADPRPREEPVTRAVWGMREAPACGFEFRGFDVLLRVGL